MMELRKLAGAALLALACSPAAAAACRSAAARRRTTLEGRDAGAHPMTAGEIDDATGTMIGS